jgi:hypothetical protein
MITYELFCQLRRLHDEKGLNAAQLAAELNLDIKTIKRWLGQPTYQQRQGTRRASKLDSFRGKIAALLEQHPYTAQQIYQQLRQTGYAGGYTILKDFVRQVRPAHKPAFLALSFAPGECAQVDWGSFASVAVGSTRRRLSFFVMVLCYIEIGLIVGDIDVLILDRVGRTQRRGIGQRHARPIGEQTINGDVLKCAGDSVRIDGEGGGAAVDRTNRISDLDVIGAGIRKLNG